MLPYITTYNQLIMYEWNTNYHYLIKYINFIQSILSNRENVRFPNSEQHHIVPKCMGGTNIENNLIYLSYREHYIAHYMLAKAFPLHPITFAITKMMDGLERIKNSRLYESAKNLVANCSKIRNTGITWEMRFRS